jgi:SAM-dependent methyltransferase
MGPMAEPDEGIDLDALALAYRHRQASASSLHRARVVGDALPPGSAILDIGGGPGYHAAVWAAQGHRPVIVDPAAAVTGPSAEGTVVVVRAVSQALPFRDGSFGLAWFHLSLHYGDWRRAIDEALRVTSPGGRIEIWTLAEDHHETSMLARWFPSVPALDAGRFPASADIEGHLEAAGASVTRSNALERREKTAGEWADAVEAGFVSTLQLVGDDELLAGLAAFRAAHPDPGEEITYELRLDRLVVRR